MAEHAPQSDLERRLAQAEVALRRTSDIEAALRRSEELRRVAVEGGRLGTWRWNLREALIWGDAAFLSLWGYPPSDGPRRLSDFTDRMSAQGRAAMDEMVTRAIAAAEEFDGQLVVASGPTSGHWVRWRGRAERERPWIVNGVSFDVTEQRLKDERLRESEARHRFLIESWTQAVWETDAQGVVVADSPSWRAYTGQTQEQWLGYGWLDAIHPDDRAYAERQWRAAVAVQGLVDAEFRLRAPDGDWRWTNVRAAPVLDAGGRIEKWVGMNTDIDARKRAEAALHESEVTYRSLFRSMDEAYAVVELIRDDTGRWADFRFLAANGAFMEHTSMPFPVGRTATELLGSPNPRWTELYGQALDSGEPIRVEETEHTLGRTFDLNIFTLDRARNRVAVLFTNITARRMAEAALRASEERQTFLLKLSDILQRLTAPDEIKAAAMRMLGTHLGVSRAQYQEVDGSGEYYSADGVGYADGLPLLDLRYRIDQFGSFVAEDFEAGRPFRSADLLADPRPTAEERDAYGVYGIRAGAGIPLLRGGKLVAILAVHDRHPHAWTDLEMELIAETAERIWGAVERARSEAALRESEERFAQFAASSVDALWIRDAATLAMEYTSPAIQTIYGIGPDAILGDVERWAALVVEEDRDPARAHLDQARRGEAVTHEFRIRRPSDGEIRWIRNTDFPLRDQDGRVERIGGLAEDVTDAREMRERQRVLVAELQHRTRNLMSVVRSMADKTMRRSTDLADFQARYGDRLAALARVQGLLSRLAEGERITFDELIRAEMAALNGGGTKATLTGPGGVALRSSTVQTFALALHELATNAVKYGAFAQPQGRLEIRWHLEHPETDGRPWLHVDWRERGVVMPAESTAAPGGGSGRELIERALPYQLGARTTYVMEADGVHCTIALPVSERQVVRKTADA